MVTGIVENLAFLVGEMHCIWSFPPNTFGNSLHRRNSPVNKTTRRHCHTSQWLLFIASDKKEWSMFSSLLICLSVCPLWTDFIRSFALSFAAKKNKFYGPKSDESISPNTPPPRNTFSVTQQWYISGQTDDLQCHRSAPTWTGIVRQKH